MQFYLAPLEGITGYIYRNAYHRFFEPMDKYYAPFIMATEQRSMTSRELNDVLPEHNMGLTVVPQLLTNKSSNFNRTVEIMKELNEEGNSYQEINLNLGCPSKTVVSKGRGSGFLAKTEALDKFLDEIYTNPKMDISIKTRIGKDEPEEFYELLEIYNKYPIKELIIHPRTQQDFYKNTPNWTIFKEALQISKNPICYNGDIFTAADYQKFTETFPMVTSIMLGRGIIANPGLIGQIKNGTPLEKARLKEFIDTVQQGYQAVFSGERNVLYKMKELWVYLITQFEGAEKYGRKIRKAQHLSEYRIIVDQLFHTCELNEAMGDTND